MSDNRHQKVECKIIDNLTYKKPECKGGALSFTPFEKDTIKIETPGCFFLVKKEDFLKSAEKISSSF